MTLLSNACIEKMEKEGKKEMGGKTEVVREGQMGVAAYCKIGLKVGTWNFLLFIPFSLCFDCGLVIYVLLFGSLQASHFFYMLQDGVIAIHASLTNWGCIEYVCGFGGHLYCF